jgi:arsenate reductase
VHVGFPDPAKATGTDDEVMSVFRAVCDDIERKIIAVLSEWEQAVHKT